MKKGKGWLLLAIGVPVLIGGYFVYKYFFPMGKKKDVSLPPPGAAPKPALTGSPSVFPLKNGSPKNDLVKQLQALLGVTVDGLFGPKTQAALFAKTGKTSIASQTEFNTVIAQLSNAAKTSANASRADKLVSDWNSNTALRLIATTTVQALEVTEDAYGALTTTGKTINLLPGYTYNRSDYVPVSSTQQGYLKFKVTMGSAQGLYKVDASKVSVG